MPSATSDIDETTALRHPGDLIETGNLLRTQAGVFEKSPAITKTGAGNCFPVIVIGAGQAGLSVSFHLKQMGIPHIVLEAAGRIGDMWRKRWDSLRLFTAAKFDGLDGYPFPADRDAFPTKDQMADYLESYAEKFGLPVRLDTPALKLSKSAGRFRVETPDGVAHADQIVVAAAGYQKPRVPEFAADLDPSIFQLHSRDYRNPSQIPEGPVLLVGAGNSGAEIAMDLVRTHQVVLAGRDVGHIPFDISGFLGRKLLVRTVIRGMFHHILTMRTPMGRKFRAKMLDHGMPLIRTRPGQLERAGVRRIDRIADIRGNRAIDVHGRQATFASVLWCTGYHPGFDWIELPIIDDAGHPRHRFGKALDAEGLYFMGLHFQYAVSSTMVAGVGRDARRVAGWIKSRAGI